MPARRCRRASESTGRPIARHGALNEESGAPPAQIERPLPALLTTVVECCDRQVWVECRRFDGWIHKCASVAWRWYFIAGAISWPPCCPTKAGYWLTTQPTTDITIKSTLHLSWMLM